MKIIFEKHINKTKNLETTNVSRFFVVRRKGFEPPTFWFVAKHSIRLSYWRKNYQKGTRLSDSLLIIVEHKKNVKY